MATIVTVTSGKGGVGKTTTSASLATGLALAGFKTVVIDFDIGLRNLDILFGMERRVIYDFVNVITGEAKLHQALIKSHESENLYILAASQTKDKDALTDEGVAQVMAELSQNFDYIVCDSPAGIERGAMLAMYHADHAIVVTNPEMASVRDSDRVVGILSSKTKKVIDTGIPPQIYVCITRFNAERAFKEESLHIEDITEDILHLPKIGVIPESDSVLIASNKGVPVITDTTSQAGMAYQDMVDRFLGKERPYRFLNYTPPAKSFWARWFGGS